MKLRKGDTVIVLKGSDRNKVGEVLRVMRDDGKVVVAGVNIRTIHQKARVQGEKGSVIKREGVIHISNVALVDPKTKKPTRITYTGVGREKQRVARRSGAALGSKPKTVKKASAKKAVAKKSAVTKKKA